MQQLLRIHVARYGPTLSILLALVLAACADPAGRGNGQDSGTETETVESDGDGSTDLLVQPDGDAEVDVPPARVAPAGRGITAGGGRISSRRYSMIVAVGGPSPASPVASPRFRGNVGVSVPQIQP